MNAEVPVTTVRVVVKRLLLLHKPADRNDRIRLVPRSTHYTGHLARGFVTILETDQYGLTRKELANYWHEESVDVLEYRGKEWVEFFTKEEPYE